MIVNEFRSIPDFSHIETGKYLDDRIPVRFFDIFVACCLLLITSPLLLLVAIILRFTGEGEVVYRQKRVGYVIIFIY